VGISRDYPLKTRTSKQPIGEVLGYEIIPSHPLKYARSKQALKMHSEESLRNGCEAANRTPRWIEESSTSGGTSPFSVRASSEMNTASSPEDDTPASDLGNSIEQGVQEASTSVTVEMASSTPSQLHVCTSR
jgi:hypothetical protein